MDPIPQPILADLDRACEIIQRHGFTKDEVRERWPSLYAMIMLAGAQLRRENA